MISSGKLGFCLKVCTSVLNNSTGGLPCGKAGKTKCLFLGSYRNTEAKGGIKSKRLEVVPFSSTLKQIRGPEDSKNETGKIRLKLQGLDQRVEWEVQCNIDMRAKLAAKRRKVERRHPPPHPPTTPPPPPHTKTKTPPPQPNQGPRNPLNSLWGFSLRQTCR